MSRLPNLTATLRRQLTPGSVVLLACAAIIFGPRAIDTIRGEPWINNEVTVVINSLGELVIEDVTFTNETVRGLRTNVVESEDGSIRCSTEHHNSWTGERKRFWSFTAFSSCLPPATPYRLCSRFSITSKSGRFRQFGPFCSALTVPLSQ